MSQQQVHPAAGGDWLEAVDPSSHQVYYFNKSTGDTQWERPAGYSALPVVVGHDIHVTHLKTGDTDVKDMTPCLGLCCIITSCYCKWPDCCGCATALDVCCLGAELYACKKSRQPQSYCQCIKAEIDCNPIKVCGMVRGQVCCLDVRCSLPCSDQIPCLLALCFWTCAFKYYPACACCTKVEDLTGKQYTFTKRT